MTSGAAEIIPLPLLAEQLPGAPDEALDDVLDATVECIARYGLAKTSLSDIAREMGVVPSTVYRKVGTVEAAVRLVMAREGHRQLARIPQLIAGVQGPRIITVFLAETIEATKRHPMVAKILHDESDWMGRLATRTLDERLADGAAVAAPFLAEAMKAGFVRQQDPIGLAHWIVRISTICLLSPPPGDLREALDELLLPLLTPASPKPPRR
ncbi:MAG: TetR/AcrR family transcriptional regulator [Actinomycetota bacterium]|nr:TetR/AcrR family transcriptional regulator [Actinomycetota bacterium]